MPDQRRHRGPHPNDAKLFDKTQVPSLQSATADLSWLLQREYAITSSLKLVGDRYKLTTRQRTAVSRCTCSSEQQRLRWGKQRIPEELAGQELWIDGYNVLTSIEAALSGGVLIRGMDGCLRDMASMHGSYRKVEETQPAIMLIGQVLESWNLIRCRWLFDQPVSNSGRLRTMLLEIAAEQQWNWEVELVPDPDPILSETQQCVATADSEILNRSTSWTNLVDIIVQAEIPEAWIVDLS